MSDQARDDDRVEVVTDRDAWHVGTRARELATRGVRVVAYVGGEDDTARAEMLEELVVASRGPDAPGMSGEPAERRW